MKKRLVSIILVICLLLSVIPISSLSVEAASKLPIAVSDQYAGSTYYQKALDAYNTYLNSPDPVRFVQVALSQKGYTAGTKSGQWAGNGSGGLYTEYGRFMKGDGLDWCASYVSWCAAAAGISDSVIKRGTGAGHWRTASGGTFHKLWSSDFKTYQDYKPQVGDIALWMPYCETCKGNYNSYSLTAHAVIVVSVSNSKNSDGSYNFTYVERGNGNKVSTSSLTTKSKRKLSDACTCGKQKPAGTAPYIVQGFFHPNWANPGSSSSTKPKLTMKFNANGGTLKSDTYTANSSGMIQRDGSDVTTNWEYGYQSEYGLWNATSFGMTRTGYTFLGWCKDKDGSSTVYDQDAIYTPETIYPSLSNGSATITMYAIWAKNKLSMKFNANGGTVNSDSFSANSSGAIFRDGVELVTKIEYGYEPPSGLWNAGSFGMTRSGYTFVGWCKNKDGSGAMYDEDLIYTPETIYPDLSKGNATITLYAIWAKDSFVKVSNGIYTLTPKHAPNLRLAVANASTENKGNIQVETSSTSATQQFEFTYMDGFYKITSVHSDKVLDVTGGETKSNTNVQQYGYGGVAAQKWYLTDAGDGYYYIRPDVDKGLCLDVAGSGTASGTNVKLFMIHNADAQKWKLTPVQNTPVEPVNPVEPGGNTPPDVTPSDDEGVHFPRVNVYHQGQFKDVLASHWFNHNVADAYEFGLMKGNSATTFNPYGDVTLAEAITMAARIHSIYTTGRENFSQGSPWYQCYLDYAYQKGIISRTYYTANVNKKASRAQFAEIFAAALPSKALPVINNLADNAIPDVKMSNAYAASIYKLYRAGILTGNDGRGTFAPDTYITRAECATIVSRMAESNNRKRFSLK